ncbi:MAG TPA: hypothetical protein VF662_01380 [Allosphingosinicella sp.]
MAQQPNQTQDSWSEGMTQFRQAIEHNVTASRLIATGAIAVGAAATAYFWDTNRRTAFMDTTKRLTEDMTSWWSGLYSGSGSGSGGEASSQ